jgi:CheY-like chemotaxis protein
MSRVVLIVEDSPEAAETLEIALARAPDLRIVVTASGFEALDFLGESGDGVAALVTDLEMPRMSGLELIERVRSDPRYHRLPIVVVSGATDPSAPGRALASGADAFFAKPYSPAEVRTLLERLVHANPT